MMKTDYDEDARTASGVNDHATDFIDFRPDTDPDG
jgi:hypothetical protein